jgi:hypothetical protein
VHGDDPCFDAFGNDAYGYAKQIGVYKQVKRTEGVSTTDIVGRMLLMTKEHHVPPAADGAELPAAACPTAVGGCSPRLGTTRATNRQAANTADSCRPAWVGRLPLT